MTDLENYLSEPSRDDRIRQVRQKIDELDVDYIYYQYVSITGRIMGKAIPASVEVAVQGIAASASTSFSDMENPRSRAPPGRVRSPCSCKRIAISTSLHLLMVANWDNVLPT